MASRPPSRWITGVLLFVAAGVFAQCGSSSDMDANRPPDDGGLTDTSPSEGSIENDGSNQGQGGAGPAYSEKCGVVDCVPDDAQACRTEAASGAGGAGDENGVDLGAPGVGHATEPALARA